MYICIYYRYKDGIEIRPSPKYRIDEDGDTVRLTIKDVKDNDKGDITCELSNNKGRESANCKLTVQGTNNAREKCIIVAVYFILFSLVCTIVVRF